MKYQHTLEIKSYNDWLILTLVNNGPKVKQIGIGTMVSGFNENDILISPEALLLLKKNIGNTHKDPAFEIISKDNIWWASYRGIIIPPNELLNVFFIPHHKTCDNTLDEEILKKLKNNTNIFL